MPDTNADQWLSQVSQLPASQPAQSNGDQWLSQVSALPSQQEQPFTPVAEWKDPNTPVGDRISKLIDAHAKNQETWDTTRGAFQRYFPGADPSPLKKPYEDAARLEGWRTGAQQQISQQDWGYYLEHTAKPFFLSTLNNVVENKSYVESMNRYHEGIAGDKDMKNIAFIERMHELQAQETGGQQLQRAGFALPAQVLDTIMAGSLTKALGVGAPAVEGAVAPTLARSAVNLGGRAVAPAATQFPAQTLEDYQERRMRGEGAAEAGLKSTGSSLLTGAVLGTMGQIPENIAGKDMGAVLARIGSSAGIGIVEQQAADILGSAAHLKTGYGVLGDFYRGTIEGKPGENTKGVISLIQQAAMFSTFAAVHEGQRPGEAHPVMQGVAESLQKLQASGLTQEAAGEKLNGAFDVVTGANNKQHAQERIDRMDKGPAKTLAQTLLDELPDQIDGRDPLEVLRAKDDAWREPTGPWTPRKNWIADDQTGRGPKGLWTKAAEPNAIDKATQQGDLRLKAGLAGVEGLEGASDVPPQNVPPATEQPPEGNGPPAPPPTTPPAPTAAPQAAPPTETPPSAEPPPAETKPGEPTNWHTEYAAQRKAGLKHEAASAKADEAHGDGQTWVNSGTEFNVAPEGVTLKGSDGKTYSITDNEIKPGEKDHYPDGASHVNVTDADGKSVARVNFIKQPDGSFVANNVANDGPKGLGRAMYDYMAKAGEKVRPSPDQTGDGKSFWKNNAELALPEAARSFKIPHAEKIAPVPPVETKPVEPEEPASKNQALEDVEKKVAAGERVSPEEFDSIIASRDVSPLEEHVLRQRLITGRSHEDIAGDAEAANPRTGEPYSRENIRLIERRALRKLGLSKGSVTTLIHNSDVQDRMIDMAERGQRVDLSQMNADKDELIPKIRSQQKSILRQKAATDKLIKQYVVEKMAARQQFIAERTAAGNPPTDKELEKFKMDPDREKYYDAEFSRISNAPLSEFEPASRQSGELRQSGGQTSVLGGDGSPVQGEAPANQAGAPPTPTAEPPSGNAGPAPAATERGQADSNFLTNESGALDIDRMQELANKAYTALKGGFESARDYLVDQFQKHDSSLTDKEAKDAAAEYYRDQQEAGRASPGDTEDILRSFRQAGYSDQTAKAEIARIEAEARDANARYEAGQGSGLVSPTAENPDLRGDSAATVQDASGRDAIPGRNTPPGNNEPAIRARDAAVGGSILDGLRRFVGEEHGYLNVGQLQEHGQQLWEKVKAGAQHVHDELSKFASVAFPATTRVFRPLGEALARLDAVKPVVAHATPDYTKEIFGDATRDQKYRLWSTFAEERARYAKQNMLTEATKASQAAAAARAAGNDEGAKTAAARATDMMRMRNEVRSFVGSQDSALKDEQDYQDSINSPEYKAFSQRYANSRLVKEMEANYRSAEGLDDTEFIDSLTQLPGRPMNMKVVKESGPTQDTGPGKPGGGAHRADSRTRSRASSASPNARTCPPRSTT